MQIKLEEFVVMLNGLDEQIVQLNTDNRLELEQAQSLLLGEQRSLAVLSSISARNRQIGTLLMQRIQIVAQLSDAVDVTPEKLLPLLQESRQVQRQFIGIAEEANNQLSVLVQEVQQVQEARQYLQAQPVAAHDGPQVAINTDPSFDSDDSSSDDEYEPTQEEIDGLNRLLNGGADDDTDSVMDMAEALERRRAIGPTVTSHSMFAQSGPLPPTRPATPALSDEHRIEARPVRRNSI